MANDQQCARELLAQEYERSGLHQSARDIRTNRMDEHLGWVREANMAIAAITAALRAAPEGFVLVPVEPTEEMVDASLISAPIAKRINPGQHLRIYGARAWAAMLAARPQGVK